MDGRQLFALFIVLIMAASTIGFALFYRSPDQDTGNQGNEPPPLVVEPTEMAFSAEGVQASVSQLLPSIKVVAETTESDFGKLSTDIYAIDGIRKVRGGFKPSPDSVLGTGFVFVGDISFETDLNTAYVLEKLEQEAGLQNIEGFAIALVALPKKTMVFNQDVNISRDLNLSKNLAEAFVSFSTMEGDELLLTINATFKGNELASLSLVETLNITAEPVAKQAVLSAPIASLENRLLLEADVSGSQAYLLSDLNARANSIEGVLLADISVPDPDPVLSISSDATLVFEQLNDLNGFLYDLNAVDVSIFNEPLSVAVAFPLGTGLDEKQAALDQYLSNNGIDANVEQGTGFLFGQVELASSDSGQAASELTTLLGPVPASIRQPGTLALQEVFDSALDKPYTVPKGRVDALLLPGHSLGETVDVNIEYSLVRGEIAYITALE